MRQIEAVQAEAVKHGWTFSEWVGGCADCFGVARDYRVLEKDGLKFMWSREHRHGEWVIVSVRFRNDSGTHDLLDAPQSIWESIIEDGGRTAHGRGWLDHPVNT